MPPFTSAAVIRVSNCLLWALRLAKFNLPSSQSSVGLFFLLVEVFCETSNAASRLRFRRRCNVHQVQSDRHILAVCRYFFCRRSKFFSEQIIIYSSTNIPVEWQPFVICIARSRLVQNAGNRPQVTIHPKTAYPNPKTKANRVSLRVRARVSGLQRFFSSCFPTTFIYRLK